MSYIIQPTSFKHLMPLCAKCNKIVDRMDQADDFRTRDMLFRVSCHVEHEEARIPYELQMDMTRLKRGVAFIQREPIADTRLIEEEAKEEEPIQHLDDLDAQPDPHQPQPR